MRSTIALGWPDTVVWRKSCMLITPAQASLKVLSELWGTGLIEDVWPKRLAQGHPQWSCFSQPSVDGSEVVERTQDHCLRYQLQSFSDKTSFWSTKRSPVAVHDRGCKDDWSIWWVRASALIARNPTGTRASGGYGEYMTLPHISLWLRLMGKFSGYSAWTSTTATGERLRKSVRPLFEVERPVLGRCLTQTGEKWEIVGIQLTYLVNSRLCTVGMWANDAQATDDGSLLQDKVQRSRVDNLLRWVSDWAGKPNTDQEARSEVTTRVWAVSALRQHPSLRPSKHLRWVEVERHSIPFPPEGDPLLVNVFRPARVPLIIWIYLYMFRTNLSCIMSTTLHT